MSKPRDERQKALLRPALDQIIDPGHPLARLAQEIDWDFLDSGFSAMCRTGPISLTAEAAGGPGAAHA